MYVYNSKESLHQNEALLYELNFTGFSAVSDEGPALETSAISLTFSSSSPFYFDFVSNSTYAASPAFSFPPPPPAEMHTDLQTWNVVLIVPEVKNDKHTSSVNSSKMVQK